MKPAIRVEHLSKRYQLAAGPRVRPDTFSELVSGVGKGLARRLTGRADAHDGRQAGEFWALDNVSFEVQPGEVVGIVGRNGAGKSTLLKIISRIVEPTRGRAEIRGRVGSLLEVGTGFHPELSGRENVFLNGSVLGMTRREIARKFDEIVAFSEVEKFLDTPVKRYSSGMSVRLAFAVAAHLEPEIMIVDEVLAVGDAAFQRKCLGKMGDVARAGRTILLVSHNTAAVRNLCTRVVWLDRGRSIKTGTPAEVLAEYVANQQAGSLADYDLTAHPRPPGREPVIRRVRLLGKDGTPANVVIGGDPLTIEFTLRLPRPVATPQVGVGVDDTWGQRVFSVASYLAPDDLPALPAGDHVVRCQIPALNLAPGRFSLSLSVGYNMTELADQVEGVVGFEVDAGDFFGNGRLPFPGLGHTLVRSAWGVEK